MPLALVVVTGIAAAAGARVVALHARLRVLQEQATTDPLTGALNRRQLDVALAAAAERRRRTNERASILLLDVDRFKDVNDAFGHPEGDRVLTAIVSVLAQRLRKLDLVFRSGGEEFVVLLPGTRFNDAFEVAEELRRLVRDADVLPEWRLSISIGVAELGVEQSPRTWIDEADAALYRAKRAGRNRVAGRPATREPHTPGPVAMPVRLS